MAPSPHATAGNRQAQLPNAKSTRDAQGHIRTAVAVDPEIKQSNRNRLRRIEGQIRGLQKMVEDDRYCPDIIVQIASVQEALRGVARNLMKNHLHHCAAKALKSGLRQEREALYEELLELIYKHLR
jgi:DNA-binding FrmR family transcriptional regulator